MKATATKRSLHGHDEKLIFSSFDNNSVKLMLIRKVKGEILPDQQL
jgi:hypothetical protein